MATSSNAQVRKSWNDGFVGDYSLTNTGSSPATLSMTVRIDGEIRKSWGTEVEDLGGGLYRFTVKNVEPGATVTGGFVADGDATQGIEIARADAPQVIEPTPVAPALPDREESAPVQERPSDANDVVVPGKAEAEAPLPWDGEVIEVKPGIDTAELQALIDDVAAGSTIWLSAGSYRFAETIEIDRDDISVLGAGSEAVTIRVDSGLGQEAFSIGNGQRTGSYTLAENADMGASQITLTGNHSFEVGDFVYLARQSTSAFYDEIGDTTWRRDVDLRTSIVEVEAVNGREITLSSGVHFDFDTSETRVQEITLRQGIELGGFTVDYGLGTANPGDFSNRLSSYDRNAVIEVEGTSGLKLTDIVAHDVPSLGVNVALSREVDADGITMTGAHNKGAGGNGYALQIRDVYDSSFTGLNDLDMRHSVVFASWRSAVDNRVHVESTDRDINFHGGRDHGNVVTVDQSIRDVASDVISPTVFFNTEGTHYGAPTDASANSVKIGYAVGSSRQDDISGYDTGAWLDGAGGHDVLRGGAGDDVLIGGEGRDLLIGGAGVDYALYSGKLVDFRFEKQSDGRLEVDDRVGNQSRDLLDGIEWVVFDDVAYEVATGRQVARSTIELPQPGTLADQGEGTVEVTTPAPEAPAVPKTPVVDETPAKSADADRYSTDKWIAVTSDTDFQMLAHHDKLELLGRENINADGSETRDLILGNDGDNLIRGNDGDDRVFARQGNDKVFGGSGNDELHGSGGNDMLHGGGGADTLFGDGGADEFRFDLVSQSSVEAPDLIADFQAGDLIDLRLIDANTARSGDQAFRWTGDQADGAGSLWQSGQAILGDVNGDGLADLLINAPGHSFSLADFLL